VDPSFIIQKIAVNALPLLLAIILHEVSHGYAAERLGDPTARMLGRLTLNPLPHIDPVGTVIVPLLLILTSSSFLFGWARPVPITTANFRNPRRDMAISAAAGPITNLLLAAASALALRLLMAGVPQQPGEALVGVLLPVKGMLQASVMWNVLLALFNLIPVPPLDGGRVVNGFLPPRLSYRYSRLEPYGMLILVVLIMTGLSGVFIGPPARLLFALMQSLSGGWLFS